VKHKQASENPDYQITKNSFKMIGSVDKREKHDVRQKKEQGLKPWFKRGFERGV